MVPEHAALPEELIKMRGSAALADDIFRPSPFWEALARRHESQLEESGYENFKRTVNLKYFSWGLFGILAHQMFPLLWWRLTRGSGNPFDATLARAAGGWQERAEGKIYAIYAACLRSRVAEEYGEAPFTQCVEFASGNPILVRIPGAPLFTQDLCNSIHEFSRVADLAGWPSAPPRILEIGAGYGRVAAVALQIRPDAKYWIVDIPPALYLSQRYLSENFPGRKVFTFRPFTNYEEVAEEIAGSDVCFFLPSQIRLLPAKSVNATICISNLHEMTLPQIRFYFEEIDRLTAGVVYTKQWMRSIARENKFSIARGEYPVPARWTTFFDRRHPIQSWFFEATYQVPADP